MLLAIIALLIGVGTALCFAPVFLVQVLGWILLAAGVVLVAFLIWAARKVISHNG
jgi:hypothetical protein